MTEVEKALKSQRKSWGEILERFSREAYSESLPWKKGIRRILLFGVGSSYFSSKLAALSVMRGLSSQEGRSRIQVLSAPSPWIGFECVPERGDLAIGLSHRSKTEATLKALELCRQRGAFTVL